MQNCPNGEAAKRITSRSFIIEQTQLRLVIIVSEVEGLHWIAKCCLLRIVIIDCTFHFVCISTSLSIYIGTTPSVIIGLGVGIVVAYFLGMGTTSVVLLMCCHIATRGRGLCAIHSSCISCIAPSSPQLRSLYIIALQESRQITLAAGTLSLIQMKHMECI